MVYGIITVIATALLGHCEFIVLEFKEKWEWERKLAKYCYSSHSLPVRFTELYVSSH